MVTSIARLLTSWRRRRRLARTRAYSRTKANPHYYDLAARRRRDWVILALGLPALLLAGYTASRAWPGSDTPELTSAEREQKRAAAATLGRLDALKRRPGPIGEGDLMAALRPLEQAGLLTAGTAKKLSGLAAEGAKEVVVDAISQLLRHFLERKPPPGGATMVVVNPAPVTLTCAPQLRVSARRETPTGGHPPPHRPKPRRTSCPA